MTEQKQQEPNTVVIIQDATPTTKQQLTSAAIQVGAAIALPVVIAASFAVATGVRSVKDKTKAKLARKQQPDLTVVPDPVED